MVKAGNGKFIVFEGIDGAGKSTQVARLSSRLRSMSYEIYDTFEPTDSQIGSLIRQIMTGQVESNHRTIASLFVADRIDHLLNSKNGILKKIIAGQNVISDRFYFSSYAYHSPYVDMDWVIDANRISSDVLKPDLNIFIDIDPQESIKRISNNRSHIELYENIEMMKKVRSGYFKAFDKLKNIEKIVIIDGNDSVENIEKKIWDEVKGLFTK